MTIQINDMNFPANKGDYKMRAGNNEDTLIMVKDQPSLYVISVKVKTYRGGLNPTTTACNPADPDVDIDRIQFTS